MNWKFYKATKLANVNLSETDIKWLLNKPNNEVFGSKQYNHTRLRIPTGNNTRFGIGEESDGPCLFENFASNE